MSRTKTLKPVFQLVLPFAVALALSVTSVLAQTAAPARPQAAKPKAPAAGTKAASPAAGKSDEAKDLSAADLAAIKRPPLPAFHPQQPKRIELANGMVIFLQEDHELPLIEGDALIRGGSKSEPADKVGLVDIFGQAWRTGGTKTKTGDELDDLLEQRAAKLETGGSQLSTTASLSCLKGDFDFVLNLFNDLLRNPEFRQEKIDLAKDQEKTGISRRNDNIGGIAGREAGKIGYGAKSPYAREPEYATVAAVTRQDLLDWHAAHVHPNNMILALTGDFDTAAMEAKLRSVLESWPAGPKFVPAAIPVTPPQTGVYFVAKDDVNQSEIRLIAAGIRRDDPDYYAVQVMNHVLSGSFASRLFSNLRTKAGLAYAVGGSVGAAFDHPGLTILRIGTKSSNTAKAVSGLYSEIEKMQTDPPNAEELQRAKDAILNSFVFEYDSRSKVNNYRANLEFHGYPADFLERYQKGVEGVTVADVARVSKKYLDKSRFAVLVVGKGADFDKPLSTFGTVTNVDITIPTGEAAGATKAPMASNPEGKALLTKALDSVGGAARLNAIKTFRRKAALTLKAQNLTLDVEETHSGDDQVHLKVNTPNGEMIMVATPQAGFMSMAAMGGPRDMPASQRDDTLKSLRREFWYVSQHAADPQFIFAANGKEKIGDVEAAVLDIVHGGEQLRWFIDEKTGRILAEQHQGNSPTGPATQVVTYSEWKTVDGVSLPFHEEVTANGKSSSSVVVSSVEINPAVDPKIFEKPKQ
jgi:zinc protease